MTEILLVSEFPEGQPGARSFGVRVHAGALTLGRSCYFATNVDGSVASVDTECEQIEIFGGVLVDELETNYGARVTFVGLDVDRLEVDQSLTLAPEG